DYGLDDDVPACESAQVRRVVQPGARCLALVVPDLARANAPFERGLDARTRSPTGREVDLADDHVASAPGGDLGDARPHDAASDDTHCLHHERPSCSSNWTD